jgi:hypothetical protein
VTGGVGGGGGGGGHGGWCGGGGVWNNNVASVLKARLDSSPSGENPWSWISMEFRRHRHNASGVASCRVDGCGGSDGCGGIDGRSAGDGGDSECGDSDGGCVGGARGGCVVLVVVVFVMFVFVALMVVVTGALVTLLQERFVTYFGVTHCVMTKPASSSATLHSSREGTRCSIALTAFGASTEYLLRNEERNVW